MRKSEITIVIGNWRPDGDQCRFAITVFTEESQKDIIES